MGKQLAYGVIIIAIGTMPVSFTWLLNGIREAQYYEDINTQIHLRVTTCISHNLWVILKYLRNRWKQSIETRKNQLPKLHGP